MALFTATILFGQWLDYTHSGLPKIHLKYSQDGDQRDFSTPNNTTIISRAILLPSFGVLCGFSSREEIYSEKIVKERLLVESQER